MPDTPRLAAPLPVAVAPTTNSYDEIPYDSHPFAQTHPSRLATIATLFGLSPNPVAQCRVLELGCAAGGNIVPMAEMLPECEFVGIDLSGRQIAAGAKVVAAAALTNIHLRHASILDVDESYGRFDYIICHGVFSWVPDEVRDRIFQIFARHLTPNGVAFNSYNTYPGWHMRGMIRDMMRYHALRFTLPGERVRQARALLDFLAQSARNDGGAFSALLHGELEILRHQADYYLFHEHLEEVNNPLYFHQFVEMAGRHRLRYLGESRLTTMVSSNFTPEVQKALHIVAGDQVQSEQYMDFVRNRTFRETLLVSADATPDWTIRPDAIRSLHITTARRLADKSGNVRSQETVQYQSPSGMVLSTSNPVIKAAMRVLGERWPATVSFDELDRAVNSIFATAGDGGQTLAVGLLNTYLAADLLELHAAPVIASAPREKPVALAVARARLAAGETAVANRRHELVRPGDVERQLIPLLDGTRDRSALLDALTELAQAGSLTVQLEGHQERDLSRVRDALASVLDQALAGLMAASMLK